MVKLNYYLFVVLIFMTSHCYPQMENEKQTMLSSDNFGGDAFGYDVEFNSKYAFISAPGNKSSDADTMEFTYAGAVYIFSKDTAGKWTEAQKLTAEHRGLYGSFGSSISINDEFAVIGSTGDDLDSNGQNNIGDAGAAYVYKIDTNGNWQLYQKLVAADRTFLAKFGYMVQLNGKYLAISAPGFFFDTLTPPFNVVRPGAVYIFELNKDNFWEEKQRVYNSTVDNGGFGRVMAFNENTLAIGMPFRRLNGGTPEGNVVIYEKDSSEFWKQNQLLKFSNSDSSGYFLGDAISINSNEMAVGEKGDAVILFTKNSSGNWVLEQIVRIHRPLEFGEDFGAALDLNDQYLLVGAPNTKKDVFGSYIKAGATYLFEKANTKKWVEKRMLLPSDQKVGDFFGHAVSMNDNEIMIGAYRNNGLEGAAYYFDTDSFFLEVAENIQSEYRIFPNPTNGEFTINTPKEYSYIDVFIVDISGKILASYNYSDVSKIQLELTTPPGMYFVHIITEKGFAVSKLIKQN